MTTTATATIARATRLSARTADLIAEWGVEDYTAYEIREAHLAAYFAAEADKAEYLAANPVEPGEYTWAEYMAHVAPMWAMVPENYMPDGMEFDGLLLHDLLREFGIWYECWEDDEWDC